MACEAMLCRFGTYAKIDSIDTKIAAKTPGIAIRLNVSAFGWFKQTFLRAFFIISAAAFLPDTPADCTQHIF